MGAGQTVGKIEMRKSLLVALGALTLASGAALPAAAAPPVVLDQATIPETGISSLNTYYVFASTGQRAFEQTFTVGKEGILDHIAIDLINIPDFSPSGDVIAELLSAPFDYTTGPPSPLASEVIPFASLPETYYPDLANISVFDVSAAHLHVNVGDTLTFSVRGGAGVGALSTTIPYAGGGVILSQFTPSFSLYGPQPNPLGFRTYVQSVPEPAAWGLMLVGFAGLGGAMRRRRALIAA